MPRAKGLRKLRWTTFGKGKRGGCRVIYYWHAKSERCLFLFAYRKNEQADLTAAQLKLLVRIVREEYDE